MPPEVDDHVYDGQRDMVRWSPERTEREREVWGEDGRRSRS